MQVLLTKLDLAKYPFTTEASNYIRSRNIEPTDLTSPELLPILVRAIDRVTQAIFTGRMTVELTQDDIDILAYPTSLMLISTLADDRARRRYALCESKRAFQLLREEPPEKLLQIAKGTFSWDTRITDRDVGGTHFDFELHFEYYVRNAARIHDLKWKLVNRVLSDGYVLLPREDFARLLEEEIQARILEKTSNVNVSLPKELEKHVEPLKAMLSTRARHLASEGMPQAIVASAMPPCLKNLLSLLQTSKHISHMGRFAMAAFLLNIGTNEEELLKMFKAFSDFDERIARYQVEHIAGKRGSHRKYTAPNCNTMRTHGLCINPDEICGTITHPLSYYRKKARMIFQKRRRPQFYAEMK